MHTFKNEPIDLVLSDPFQKDFIGKRFSIPPINQSISFQEWCQHSPLSDALTIELIALFINPTNKQESNFINFDVVELVQYVNASHTFYNNYYLQKLDQLTNINEIAPLINQFTTFFRLHMVWEEKNVLPYFHFLKTAVNNNNFSISDKFAVIHKHSSMLSAEHEATEHQLLQNILRKIQSFGTKYKFDLQWEYYKRLILNFQLDLAIHEFIEDKILYVKAKEFETQLLNEIRLKSLQN